MSEQNTSLPPWGDFDYIIQAIDPEDNASQFHGRLCGYLSMGKIDLATQFIQDYVSRIDKEQFAKEIHQLVRLMQTSREQLTSFNFEFQILIPDDDSLLRQRAQALGHWCQGFTDAFIESGIEISELKSEESRDAVYHMTEVAQLDYQALEVAEDDETAFMELYEYIRMAVMMLHTEQNHSVKKATHPSPTTHSDDDPRTLH